MPDAPPATPPPAAAGPAPQAVFAALGNEKRRRMLVALAGCNGLAATQLAPLAGLRQDAALKHLNELRAAGLVSMKEDPQDRRRQLYTLTSAVTARRTEAGLELDFGCCLARL